MTKLKEQAYLQIEKDLRETSFDPGKEFSARVMRGIAEKDVGYFRRLFMQVITTRKTVLLSAVVISGVAALLIWNTQRGFSALLSSSAIIASVMQLMTWLEGSAGAILMLAAMLGTLTAVFIRFPHHFKVAGTLATVAFLTFQVRSFSTTFFNTASFTYNDDRIANAENSVGLKIEQALSRVIEPLLPSEEYVAPAPAAPFELGKGKQIAQSGKLPSGEADAGLALDSRGEWLGKGAAAPVLEQYNERTAEVYKKILNPEYWDQSWRSNTEQYLHYGENERTDARTSPVSTFGLDVDTASYTNVRRMLQAGQLPPPDAVRVEEFINYFDYSYPVQTDKPFTVSYEIAPAPLDSERLFLKLGIRARDVAEKRLPWNLVFLVDVSGSMADQGKLDLVRPTMKLIANQMRAGDRIAIVTYAGNAGLVLDASGIEKRGTIVSAIDSLYPGGGTNGSGGIQLAYDIAQRNYNQEGVNRVILATDGDFNVGVTSLDELIRMVEARRKGGVGLTTLGFGSGNLKDGTMEQLANKGNGNYFYIDSFREAGKVLEHDLVGNMQTVAKDVKLQLEFNPEKVSQYRLIGYENRKLNREDFNNDTIDSGEVGSGHTVTALYELILTGSHADHPLVDELRYQPNPVPVQKPATATSSNDELGFLKIRFKEPSAESSKLMSFPIKSEDVRGSAAQSSEDFRFASAVAYFAQALKNSKYAGGYTLEQVAALASGALGADSRGLRHEFVDMVRSAARLRK
ncbi:MAG: von Willebrand factor type A domain-containing protein [Oligoflexia bacterium]|nr:von Willebrand factor type A domain-containing protein [Oligoflexia bacterium]